MNAPAKIDWQAARDQRNAILKAKLKVAAERLADWADNERDEYRALMFWDALQLVSDSDLAPDMDACRSELGIDEEGFVLDEAGYRVDHAERVFVPGAAS